MFQCVSACLKCKSDDDDWNYDSCFCFTEAQNLHNGHLNTKYEATENIFWAAVDPPHPPSFLAV